MTTSGRVRRIEVSASPNPVELDGRIASAASVSRTRPISSFSRPTSTTVAACGQSRYFLYYSFTDLSRDWLSVLRFRARPSLHAQHEEGKVAGIMSSVEPGGAGISPGASGLTSRCHEDNEFFDSLERHIGTHFR